MSVLVFAQPAATQPPPASTGPSVEYTDLWTGVDGITWNLSSWTSGVYLQSGVTGVGHAQVERWTQDSPAIPGSLFGGARSLAKTVQWPIVITTSTTPDTSWKDLCRRWWKGWSKDQPGTWTRVDSDGLAKRLKLLHNPSGDFSLNIDPGLLPWVPWMVDAVADSPYWEGDPITQSFAAPKQYLFFGGGDPDAEPAPEEIAPPFFISQASTLATASISNPGDVDVWPLLTIDGPFAAWSISINGGTVSGPAVADGDQWVISTDPAFREATKNGSLSVTGLLTACDPRPVPPGEDVPITIAATGAGTVSCQITPLYEMGL